MKKLLLFLLLPALTFAQEFELKHEILEQGPFNVGDTITVKYTLTDLVGNVNLRLIQFDTGHDTKKVTRIGTANWQVTTPANKTVTNNYWTNYTYVGPTGVDWSNLHAQYLEGWTYSGGGTEGVNRYTIQSTDDIDGQLFLQQFRLEDIASTGASDYTDMIRFNWAHVRDDASSSDYGIAPIPGRSLGLDAVGDTPAGTITFQLQTPNAVNATDYRIVLEPRDLYDAYQTQDPSTIDYSQYPSPVQGTLDSSGKFITTELLQNIEYVMNVFIVNQYDQESQESIYPTWLDDVVTVSDVLLTFKQAIGTEVNGGGNEFEYGIQNQLANVVRQGPNDPVDFQDSYALLAHLVGVLPNGANDSNVQEFYPITSFNNGAMNWSGWFDTFGVTINSEEEWLAQRTFTLTDSQAVTFNVAHGLMGDADLSHSTTPPLNASTEITAKSRATTLKVETTDVDIASTLNNGVVEVTIDVIKDNLAGIQFNISYDKSILEFKEVVFDTGNTMTNFAKQLDGKINIGTIDPQAKEVMKAGRPFKLVFDTKQSINNTAGLISFDVTDAVTVDGNKVKLQIR